MSETQNSDKGKTGMLLLDCPGMLLLDCFGKPSRDCSDRSCYGKAVVAALRRLFMTDWQVFRSCRRQHRIEGGVAYAQAVVDGLGEDTPEQG